jgi:hypothetical protein
MVAVAPHAVLQPKGAANANDNTSFPKIVNFFAAKPEPARDLFAGDEVDLWGVIWFVGEIAVRSRWHLGLA